MLNRLEAPSVAVLRQELAELRATNQRLERENLEFRQQAAYWKSRHGSKTVNFG
jgi:FtsZ-binding cell division protein ZapB